MKKIYELSGTPARPPVKRTPVEEEEFLLSKELMTEILSASRSRFWKERADRRTHASEYDFDQPLMFAEMKKKFSLLAEEYIEKEVKHRIYLHHLR